MRNKLLMLFLGIILLSISLIGHATTVTFTVADIKEAIGDLHDSDHQWGLWAVRVRPVIESGSYTMTGASVTQVLHKKVGALKPRALTTGLLTEPDVHGFLMIAEQK